MFKSVFTKYITAFMLIIAISFLILALILCQMVNTYSIDAKAQMVERTADTLSEVIHEQYNDYETSDFNQYIYFHRSELDTLTSALADYNEDIIILIADSGGAILLTDNQVQSDYLQSNVSREVMSRVSQEGEQTFNSDLGGVFTSGHMVHAVPVDDPDGNLVGAIFVCSPSKGVAQLIETMVKSIIMTCLWVMFAALIAVYFISEKIIDPLKQMSKAAKAFAAGKIRRACPRHRTGRGGGACHRLQQHGRVAGRA
ncbi:MAG: hypothetical protein IJ493_12535 [Clostridia bacterium]|nr:hypothetical protein [Clostridia bacterium]